MISEVFRRRHVSQQVGTSRCDVPARVQRAERIPQDERTTADVAPLYAARTAQRAVPTTRFLSAAITLAAVVAWATGCGRSQVHESPPPPSVTVAPVEQREIVEWDEFTGRTEAVEKVEVRPRVSGHIQEVHFQSGQLVRKGDVLFVID